MTLQDRAAERQTQWKREGLEQGASGRDLLMRVAAARFGSDAAARLTDALATMDNFGHLGRIGESIERSESAAEALVPVQTEAS